MGCGNFPPEMKSLEKASFENTADVKTTSAMLATIIVRQTAFMLSLRREKESPDSFVGCPMLKGYC